MESSEIYIISSVDDITVNDSPHASQSLNEVVRLIRGNRFDHLQPILVSRHTWFRAQLYHWCCLETPELFPVDMIMAWRNRLLYSQWDRQVDYYIDIRLRILPVARVYPHIWYTYSGCHPLRAFWDYHGVNIFLIRIHTGATEECDGSRLANTLLAIPEGLVDGVLL